VFSCLRPALRGWKHGVIVNGVIDGVGLRPALRGWKRLRDCLRIGCVFMSPTRLEGMETFEGLLKDRLCFHVSDPP
jgi:hypothetical protein